MRIWAISFLHFSMLAFVAGCTDRRPAEPERNPQRAPQVGNAQGQEVFHCATGSFNSVHGESGRVSFGVTFLSPPQIMFSKKHAADDSEAASERAIGKTIIRETTLTHFEWKNTAGSGQFDGEIRWQASGHIRR